MKERLDKLLVSLNYFDTRERAKKAIMAGLVQVNEQVKDKAGDLVDTEAMILVKGSDLPYVSRGGLKLEKGLAVFDLAVAGKTFIDIGSSTGGFTDSIPARLKLWLNQPDSPGSRFHKQFNGRNQLGN